MTAITVQEKLKELQALVDKGYGKLPIIYATDDEGNAFHTVHNKCSELTAVSLKERYLDFYDQEDEENKLTPNCICIN